jgi:coenzyme F420 hydrogenase subunit beta
MMESDISQIKTFKDLEKEIIEPNICSLCGGCVSVCAFNDINAIKIKNNKPTFIEADEKICLDCGLCYQICPRTSAINKHIDKDFGVNTPIGKFKKLTWAKTADPNILRVSQDGGIVTTLIKYLLDTQQIDGAIVNYARSNWESFPIIIKSSSDLLKTSGTRYSTTPALEIFQKPKIYSHYIDKTLNVRFSQFEDLLSLDDVNYARLAFVGCPCHIQAIRKMKLLKIKPGVQIKYLIGLFCMENFSYSRLMNEIIEKKLKVKLNEIKKLNIKKDFIVTLDDDSTILLPFKEVEDFVRPNCLFCDDFSNIYADISVGGIGAPQDHSVVLTRTEVGENLLNDVLHAGYIEEYHDSEENLEELREKNIKIIAKMSDIKKSRAAKNRGTKFPFRE